MPSKTALVIGASSGIGKTIATSLAESNWQVFGAARTEVSVPGVTQLKMDVCDSASVEHAIQQLKAPIDALIYCAGYGLAGPIEDTSVDEWQQQMDTNVTGALRVVKAVLPSMRARYQGRFIFISSIAGEVSVPFQGAYSASKFALEGLVESLWYELRPFSVKVSLIQPGDFNTGFTSARKLTHYTTVDSPYSQATSRMVAQFEKDEKSGPTPEIIAQLCLTVLEKPKPKLRYTTGAFIQRMGPLLKRVFPERVFLSLFRLIYNLP